MFYLPEDVERACRDTGSGRGRRSRLVTMVIYVGCWESWVVGDGLPGWM
jgi:hypothetical protein